MQTMFEFLFKYPASMFAKGRFVLLSSWPAWLLVLLIALSIALLVFLTHLRFSTRAPGLTKCRIWTICGMQSTFITLMLLLLWQPAITVAALTSHQNIIAVVIDSSRSMGIADSGGKTRETDALSLLQTALLPAIQKRFQVRLYRLGGNLAFIPNLSGVQANDPATDINGGLKKLANDTKDLPIGAILLLSDGGQNSVEMGESGVALETLDALRNRRLPVHTLGFGILRPRHDVELENISVAPNAIVKARLSAAISFIQYGFTGQTATISIRDGDKPLGSKSVNLSPDGVLQTESLFFSPGDAGARDLRFTISLMPGEENLKNNEAIRPLLVSEAKRRVLYVEGEPRWEFKFIRRAEEDDPTIDLVSMLRTSENKIYRQGIKDPSELAEGFPTRGEDLFGYSGIIIGSVDAAYFSPMQRELLREYVDRRGGGILFLGGRMALSEGGWGTSDVNELLPAFLPNGRNSFHRNPAAVELTSSGTESAITRLLDDPAKNAERWKKLTYLADYQDAGTPKPGASVLIQMNADRRKLPLLITQPYGHGRTAILATGGTWRWQMVETLGDRSHDLFWQQLIRWLIAETPGPVMATVSPHILMDAGKVQLTADVHDAQFQPALNAHVFAHIFGPGNSSAFLDLSPSQQTPGRYEANWNADKAGGYLADISAAGQNSRQELGRDTVTFRREDGVAENFHTSQNRRLLQQLSKDTGGRYWQPNEVKTLPQEITYSEAGISVQQTYPIWNMPIVFLVLLGILSAEWLLRRRWGII
jgi:uncharacterized membrane protein